MNYITKCRDCLHNSRCKSLLGPSYHDDRQCDWSPSKFALAEATKCPSCYLKYGHAMDCEYVAQCRRRVHCDTESG